MKKFWMPIVCLTLLGGCASHKYVKEQIAVLAEQRDQVDQAQDAKLAEIDVRSREALDRANSAHQLAAGKFLYSAVVPDVQVTFSGGQAKLGPAAAARLIELASQLKAENRNVYLEIQGHTDSTGSEAANEAVGLKRAEAVRQFLSRQGIALNRMATISYGETAPQASNATRAGRAANRRVVLVVMY